MNSQLGRTYELIARDDRLKRYLAHIETLRDPIFAVQLEGIVKHFDLDVSECRTKASCSKCERRERCAGKVA